MPKEILSGRISPIGPISQSSQFSRTDIPSGATAGLRFTGPGILNTRLKALGKFHEAQHNFIVNSDFDPETIQRLAFANQNTYNEKKYELKNLQSQIGAIQNDIDAGKIDPELGKRAIDELTLPPSAIEEYYPKEKPKERPLSPTELGYPSYMDMADEIAIGAIDQTGNYNPNNMAQAYFQWRVDTNYNAFGPTVQKQLDSVWDSRFVSDPVAAATWSNVLQTNMDVKASRVRADDPAVLRAIAEKATPLGRAILNDARKPARDPAVMRMRGPTGKEFNVDIADLTRAMLDGATMIVPESTWRPPKTRKYPSVPANFGWANRSMRSLLERK